MAKWTPVTLGEALSPTAGLAVTADPARQSWTVRWQGPAGSWLESKGAPRTSTWSASVATSGVPAAQPGSIPTDGVPDGTLAVVSADAGRFVVRSGCRVVGRPPRFPSASVILSRERDGAWEDVGMAEEIPELAVSAASLAVTAHVGVIAYLVPAQNGRALCRVVQFETGPSPAAAAGAWEKLPDYPHAPGMAGIMAGQHRGALIAAGGANFPDLPPWEGGVKKFYDDIYVLPPGAATWQTAGKLPTLRAYAAVVSLPAGILLIGGENADAVFADALLLSWDGARVTITVHSKLPAPVTSAVAAVLGGSVYLAGGYAAGTPRFSQCYFWRLDLDAPAPKWVALPPWEGPTRALAVAAAVAGQFFLISGIEVTAVPGRVPPEAAPPVYLTDAHVYHPAKGWSRLPDLPWSAIAAPSPAPVTESPARVFVLGGVDGRQVGKLPRATVLPDDILCLDVQRSQWSLWPQAWPTPVVCIPAVQRDGGWLLPSGETMAGKRTTATMRWEIRR